jgi:hypothetical protein
MMSSAITNYMLRFVRLECGDSEQCRRVRYKMTAGANHEPCHLIVKFTRMARELDKLTSGENTGRPRF